MERNRKGIEFVTLKLKLASTFGDWAIHTRLILNLGLTASPHHGQVDTLTLSMHRTKLSH